MTILVLFHQRRYRQFKSFYYHHMHGMMKQEFPNLPSYSRFIKLMPRSIMPLCAYLQSMMGDCTGISYIDSTKIAVCHNKRIYRHKVFKGLATRGKSSMAGFTALSCTPLSITRASLYLLKSLRVIRMTECLLRIWQRLCLARCLG